MNWISQILDCQDRVVKEQYEIEGAFLQHFLELFRSINPSKEVINDYLKHVEN